MFEIEIEFEKKPDLFLVCENCDQVVKVTGKHYCDYCGIFWSELEPNFREAKRAKKTNIRNVGQKSRGPL